MGNYRRRHHQLSLVVSSLLLCLLVFFTACSELEKPKTEPFFAQTAPPEKKEFRWSNGRMPKSFDPAAAVAPPETDVVRAVYEGLTDTDPKTLATVPAVAAEWKSSEDFKTWTFKLRPDARWSNGERVTAADFVRSWKRLAEMGEKVVLRKLLKNIVGMDTENFVTVFANEDTDVLPNFVRPGGAANEKKQNPAPAVRPPAPVADPAAAETPAATPAADPKPQTERKSFGVEALDQTTLKVSLVEPDRDFPALVSHPIFRPVYGDGKYFESDKLNAAVISNGAFRIASVGVDGVTLDRSEYFWGKDRIELERVRMVPIETAEKALEAYRAGEVDAVTNAQFEPLALKLLTPYDDFQRTTHSALNFYEINRRKKPFDDRRVREALAISIERERLTEGEMEGSTKPALSFLPFSEAQEKHLVQDKERAKKLLAEAGYPDGENFPAVRLVINRNDLQQRIAKAVVRMWKQTLNVDTVIIVKESAELEAVRDAGEFDVLRRGAVFPTADKTAAMTAILAPRKIPEIEIIPETETAGENQPKPSDVLIAPETEALNSAPETQKTEGAAETNASVYRDDVEIILSEEEALAEIPAIPLYFPTSYSLVKPYVAGFAINTLDAPSLKDVRIDNHWQPKKPNGES
jgi:oligopeptide transport system substrate-binding protein